MWVSFHATPNDSRAVSEGAERSNPTRGGGSRTGAAAILSLGLTLATAASMTLERLLILTALSALTFSASAQDAPAGDVIIQAPHRYEATRAAFSADDAYVMVYDETSGGSLIEMATGRVVAQDSSLDFSEVVQRLSQGTIDPVLAEPPSYDDYYNGVAPEPRRWVGPGGGVAEFRPSYIDNENPDDEIPPILSVGGQEFELAVIDLWYMTDERFAVLRHGHPIEIREVANPREVVRTVPGRSGTAQGDYLATLDDESVVLTSFRTLQSERIAHGLPVAGSLRADLNETTFLVTGPTHSVVFSREPGHAVIWRGEGEVLGRTPRSLLIRRAPEGQTPQIIRRNLRTGRERVVLSDSAPIHGGHHGAFVIARADSILVMDKRGRRRSIPVGNRHSVWHSQTYEGLLVLSGRFGVQRWTPEGVLDAPECDGTGLLGLMSTGSLASTRGRCSRRGVVRPWGEYEIALALDHAGERAMLSNGVLRNAAGGGVQLEGVSEPECGGEDNDACSWGASLGNSFVAIDVYPDNYYDTPAPQDTVHDAATGAVIASYAPESRLLVAPDGDRYAVIHGQRGEVFNATGERQFRFRMPNRNREARPEVEFLADGKLRWSYEGRPARVIDRRGRRSTASANASVSFARCRNGRWRIGTEETEGPSCIDEGARGEMHGDRVIVRDREGLVRMYTHGRILTLGTIRRGAHPLHFVYDDQGRWWSSNPRREPLARRVGGHMEPMQGESDPSLLELLVRD